jgi:selenocysteine lyase/cysteine desulfurase
VDSLAGRILEGARAKGYEPMASRDGGSGSGIVSIRKTGVDSAEVAQHLFRNGVSIAPRFGWVRAAPHFYNNEADVDRFLELLP